MPDPQVPEQMPPDDPFHLTAEQLNRLRDMFNANVADLPPDIRRDMPIPEPLPGEPRAARFDWTLEVPTDLRQDLETALQAAPAVPQAPARPGGRRTRRDQNAPTQEPPLVQRGYRPTLTRAANLTPTAPQQPQQRIPIQVDAFTGAEFRDNSLWITADFIEGGTRAPLHFSIYADTGRALAPYAQEALKRIAEILRDINNLPEPRRREIPNATVGERMFNMIQLLMDKAEVSEQVQNEWQVLALEYERHVGGGGLQ